MAVTTIAENTTTLMVSSETRKMANKRRMREYYGLSESSNVNFLDSLKIKKMENQKRRLHYYGLQYLEWTLNCKSQNETMKRKYYGLDNNNSSSGTLPPLAIDSDSSPENAFDFDQHCKEMEEFMKTDWAMEMEKESIRQWEMDQLQKTNN